MMKLPLFSTPVSVNSSVLGSTGFRTRQEYHHLELLLFGIYSVSVKGDPLRYSQKICRYKNRNTHLGTRIRESIYGHMHIHSR